jgi:hypothetical protein
MAVGAGPAAGLRLEAAGEMAERGAAGRRRGWWADMH